LQCYQLQKQAFDCNLQEQRKSANMNASFERQQLLQAVEKLQQNKGWEAISASGRIDVAALTRR
jgi:hypothetical protein